MNNTNVGTIELVATIDTSRFKANAKEVEKTAKKVGQDVEESADRADKRGGRSFANFAKSAVAGLLKISGVISGVLTTAVSGMIIKGGISRALNIEDAQGKLRGLGHDAKSVEEIMKSALASVKGTAYGLDQAATAAASAVAAGVKPGQDLTKYLSTAADAATIAGVSFNEMGSIFGKVQTQQRAYTMELNQLADRGIPIYQWLQKELKVNQETLREMVAAGKIDAKTYFKVIQDNIGGAALESGKTTRGAWMNMRAAMARVGEAIVKDIIPRVREGFGTLTKWFDDNSDNIVRSVGQVIDALKNTTKFGIELGRNVGRFLAPNLKGLLEAVRNLLPALREFLHMYVVPIAQLVGGALIAAINVAIGALKMLLVILQPVVSWLNQNRNAVLGVAAALGTFAIALRIQAAVMALDVAIATLRMGFIASTVATVGFTGSLGALALGVKGVMAAISPLHAIVVALSAAVGVLAFEWLRGKNSADNLRQSQDKLRESSNLLKDAQDQLKGSAINYEGAQLRAERAQKNYNEAVKKYGPDSLEAREAQNQLDRANQDVTDSFKQLIDAEIEYSNQQVGKWKAEDEARAAENAARKWNDLAEAKRNAAKTPGDSGGAAGFLGIRNSRGFASGGFTGRGGVNEPAGIVHRGEYVIPKSAVDQSTGLPKDLGGTEYNIGTINISSEVDGERWLRRLTGNQEITSAGLVPTQSYMG